jgi:6-phosphogluconolactonase
MYPGARSTYSSMTGMENSSRRSFLAKLSALAVSAGPWSLPQLWAATPGGLIFAGTYTDKGTSRGIYAFGWDADAGVMTPLGLAAAAVNPSFLALSPDRRHLYAVNEVDDYHGQKSGSISSFAVAEAKLKPINVVSSMGGGPANIAVDSTGKAVFVANYGGGSAASFRVLPGGGLSKAVSSFQYTGHGADPKRQANPHAHCTTVSRDNRYVLVNDLGLDLVSVYHLDSLTARLTPNTPPSYQALPGSGPRSFAFHPSGRWAYSLNEIASTLDVLAWDGELGTLTRIQNISTLSPGFTGSNTAATVAVDSEGRFVYASNRGENSVAVFSVHDREGTLKLVQQVDCGGTSPRHFALDPGNQWLLVANQDSSNIVVFARNARSGHLTPTGNQYPLSFPVCLVFS